MDVPQAYSAGLDERERSKSVEAIFAVSFVVPFSFAPFGDTPMTLCAAHFLMRGKSRGVSQDNEFP